MSTKQKFPILRIPVKPEKELGFFEPNCPFNGDRNECKALCHSGKNTGINYCPQTSEDGEKSFPTDCPIKNGVFVFII